MQRRGVNRGRLFQPRINLERLQWQRRFLALDSSCLFLTIKYTFVIFRHESLYVIFEIRGKGAAEACEIYQSRLVWQSLST